MKRGRKDKDKDEDPSTGSDRVLKRRKTSKDSEPTTDPKKKDSTSGSSKGTQSKTRSSGKSVQSEEPVSEVADSNMPHDQEGNLGVMKMNQGKRLPLEVIGSRNLHQLKNPLTRTGMLARRLRK
ncbi:hypothetical protein Tco_0275067, partial [Tanacetum coccineum]